MKVIALGHQKKVGKDTAARLLVTHFRMDRVNAVDIGFADKVKDVSYDIYSYMGLQPRLYYEQYPEAKDMPLPGWHVTPRQIWIKVGNMCREIDEKCWIRNALAKVKADIVIIRDLRFRNEAEYLMDTFNTTLIKLIRDGAEKGDDPAEVDMLNFDGWHHVIHNNGSMQFLRDSILEALK